MLKPKRNETERNWNDGEASSSSSSFLSRKRGGRARSLRSVVNTTSYSNFSIVRLGGTYLHVRVNGFARTGGGDGGGEVGNTGSLRATSVRLVAALWAFSVV